MRPESSDPVLYPKRYVLNHQVEGHFVFHLLDPKLAIPYRCSSLHKWFTGPIPLPIGYAFAIASRT